MRYLVLCLLSVSCAAPVHREFHDGPMMRPPPRAAPFSPAEDAPNPFDRPSQPRIQPQPRPERVLPEDEKTRREPGVWGTEAPEHAGPPDWATRKPGDPIPSLSVLNVPLPVRDDAIDAYDTRPSEMCSEVMKIELDVSSTALGEIKNLSKVERRCFVATEYLACLVAVKEGMEDNATKEGKSDLPGFRLLSIQFAAAIKAADAFKTEACANDAETPVVKALSRIIEKDSRYSKHVSTETH